MRILSILLLLTPAIYAALVKDVRAELDRNNFVQAEKLIRSFRLSNGVTPEFLEAHSWLGRGALKSKRFAQADKYAGDTRSLCLDLLKVRKLDAEPGLPTALGASIEVHGHALAGLGRRAEAVSFLKQELARWKTTSMRARIQKNLHLLSLVGSAPPPLEMKEWLGPKPAPLTAAAGKPMLLFFWAHWCSDCKYQGPMLAQLRDRYSRKGLTLMAPTQYYGYVSRGEEAPPEREKPYIDEVRREFYPGLSDVPAPISQENFQIYGVASTPTLVLLDSKGVVRMYHPGKMTYEELATEIERIL